MSLVYVCNAKYSYHIHGVVSYLNESVLVDSGTSQSLL